MVWSWDGSDFRSCLYSSQRCATIIACLLQSWDLTSVARTGGWVKTMHKGHQHQISAYQQLRWGQEKCQQPYTSWACTVDERGYNRTHSQVNNFRRDIFSGFWPSGSTLILPTLHYITETQLGNKSRVSTPKGREQTLPWQGSNNHRAKGRPHSMSRADFGHYNTNQTPY